MRRRLRAVRRRDRGRDARRRRPRMRHRPVPAADEYGRLAMEPGPAWGPDAGRRPDPRASPRRPDRAARRRTRSACRRTVRPTLFLSRAVIDAAGDRVIGEAREPLEGAVIEAPAGAAPGPDHTVGIVAEMTPEQAGTYQLTGIRLRFRTNGGVEQVREGISTLWTVCAADPSPLASRPTKRLPSRRRPPSRARPASTRAPSHPGRVRG